MNSGIPKIDIKLGRSSLYIKKSLHGRVVNGSYIPQHSESMSTYSIPSTIAMTSQSNDAASCNGSESTSHVGSTTSIHLLYLHLLCPPAHQ